MAGGARNGADGTVIHRRASPIEEIGRRVTALTRGTGGGNVAGRQTGGLNAIVATGATDSYARVIERGSRPGEGRMTGITIGSGSNMVRRLTQCDDIVVAAVAAALHLDMIESYRRHPGDAVMAGIASIRRGNVVGGFGCGSDRSTDAVACRTYLGRAFEYRVDVTRFARQVTVLSQQLEPRGQMVEGRSDDRLCARLRRSHQRDEQQEHAERICPADTG